MICLERLDARALQLPFEIIPSLELSKGLFSSMATGLVFLLPYLLSMKEELSFEYLCPSSN